MSGIFVPRSPVSDGAPELLPSFFVSWIRGHALAGAGISLALKAPPCTSICFPTSLPCLEVISREAPRWSALLGRLVALEVRLDWPICSFSSGSGKENTGRQELMPGPGESRGSSSYPILLLRTQSCLPPSFLFLRRGFCLHILSFCLISVTHTYPGTQSMDSKASVGSQHLRLDLSL